MLKKSLNLSFNMLYLTKQLLQEIIAMVKLPQERSASKEGQNVKVKSLQEVMQYIPIRIMESMSSISRLQIVMVI